MQKLRVVTQKLAPAHPWKRLQRALCDHLHWCQLCLDEPPPKLQVEVRQRPRSRHFGQTLSTPTLLVLAVTGLTSTIGYRFYNEPKLDVGTIAPQTLIAPDRAKIEDPKATEDKRRQARSGATPVLVPDDSVNQKVQQALETSLSQGRQLRTRAGSFPFTAASILSTGSQRYLRQAPEWEWQTLLQTLDRRAPLPPLETERMAQNSLAGTPLKEPLTPAYTQALAELQAYRRIAPVSEVQGLLNAIAQARRQYTIALGALLHPDAPDNELPFDASLLNLTEKEWQTTQTGLQKAARQMLAQGIYPALPPLVLQQAIALHLAPEVSPESLPLAQKLLSTILQPNLIKDDEQTRLQAEQAALSVEPVIISIHRGDVIVQAGEKITQSNFAVLDHFGLSRREVNWGGLVGFAGLISGAIALFWWVAQTFHPRLRRRDQVLLILLTLSMPLVILVGLPGTNLPAIGLLVGSFYGSTLGATLVTLLTVVVPLGMEIHRAPLIASAIGGLVATRLAGRLRSREELALLGILIGLTQGAVYLLGNLVGGPFVWYTLLGEAALVGLGGVAWSVVALGISPYLEHFFDLLTPIRLAELANPNRPLLKRLASEAPGTFQHTLFVASLAEAAARELGCNVELVRAGTLYHDIGKMHDPLGFIENQMGGPNKHEAIADPWVSAELIKKHVSEGLVMARKYRLPGAIQAFIPEHQGTMLIAYFYYQAQQIAQSDPHKTAQEADFRYDGPIPQSRETGIVMLADSCEAALRSLKETCPEAALAMIHRILKGRWQDHQLVDSGLTREELDRIAKVFVRVWQQFNHQRIAYPKLMSCVTKESSIVKP